MVYIRLWLVALLLTGISPLASASWEQLNAARLSEGTETTYINPFNEGIVPVRYEKIEGQAVVGGDMVLGTIEEVQGWSQSYQENDIRSLIEAATSSRWTDNTIPYELATVDPTIIGWVNAAIVHWEQNTAIKFVLRTPGNHGWPDSTGTALPCSRARDHSSKDA